MQATLSRPASRLRAATLAFMTVVAAALAGCGTATKPPPAAQAPQRPSVPDARFFTLADDEQAREMVLFALGLLDIGYQFGGRNPEAGLDCSGMVAYIVENISGHRLPHNAAQIADSTRPIALGQLQPGDLVFFNTMQRRHSHMGVYIGDGRFIHAPSSRGRVRVDRMDNRYFAARVDGARTLVSGPDRLARSDAPACAVTGC
ncbi:C40 family peptidase [Thauera mechernichensis]